jgi:tyrosinase
MYPNSYLTPFPETYGTYTLQGGGKINDTLSTPLKPFSTDTRGSFYTSRGSRSLSTFGYSYPGIEDWNHTPEQLQANVTAHVNALYGSSNSLSKRDVLAPRAEVTEWSVTIGVSKFDLGGLRFIIRIFLGDIPENPSDWATSDACVGSFVMLPPPSITGPLPQVLSYNEIGLTEALKARGYDGQDLAATIKYLEEGLQWRVQLVGSQFPFVSLLVLRGLL